MQEIQELIEKLYAFIGDNEYALAASAFVLFILLYRKICRAIDSIPSLAAQAEEKKEAKAQKKEESDKRKQLKAEFEAGLDVIFSGKSQDDLNDDEKVLADKVFSFFKGGRK